MQPYDIYELMIIPPNKKAEMIMREIKKKDKANLNLVRDLITLGANLEWQDNVGFTALHVCAFNNHPEIARILLDAGADLNMRESYYGLTALHECAYWNRPEIARILIDAGADLNMQVNDGWTAVHVCARFNRPEIARMLIDAGADLNIQSNCGFTALHVCGRENHLDIARMLLDAGADKTMRTHSGIIPYELTENPELQELLKV